jgi:hypothetical protein
MTPASDATQCQACAHPFNDRRRPLRVLVDVADDREPQLFATYCERCWHGLSGSIHVLENVIRS